LVDSPVAMALDTSKRATTTATTLRRLNRRVINEA
jgi:hypothetical protein